MNKIGIAIAGVVVLVGVSFCLSGVAHSDAGAAPDPLKQLCESIIDQAARGEKKGFDLFQENMANRPTTTFDKELWNASARRQLGEMGEFQEKFGPFLGCEQMEEKNLTSTLRRYVYLAKYERNVVRWTFVFYRPHDEWKILAGKFRDIDNDPSFNP
jgi:hypothetical protein